MTHTANLFSGVLSAAETISAYGPEALADHELLEAFLDASHAGDAPVFLAAVGGLKRLLALGLGDLQEIGLSTSEAARVQVLGELQRRGSRKLGEKVTSPRAAGAYLLPKAVGLQEERFGLLCLDSKGQVIADRIIGAGTASGVLISPREVFREALRFGATSVLVWHNHPSGDPTPSREDMALTRRLRQAGDAVGVPLADHIVVGETWHSFRAAEGWDA